MNPTFRLTTTVGIAAHLREQIVRLLDLCNAHDDIDIPIFVNHLESGHYAVTAIGMFEEESLIGFGAVPDDDEPEVCVMVNPKHRRLGIGTQILGAICDEGSRRGLSACLIINDQTSQPGNAFLRARQIPYISSEFRLKLDIPSVDRSRPRITSLRVRPAGTNDKNVLTGVIAASFGVPGDEARATVARTAAESGRRFYLAELDGKPIGAVRAGEWDGNGDITAFGVVPELRGKGHGRQILLDIVDLLLEQGFANVLIEVATENRNALGLYQSVGFRVVREFGYYRLSMAPVPSQRQA